MNSYSQMLKKAERDRKKKMKLEKIEYLKELERKEQLQMKLYAAKHREEREEAERLQKERNERIKKIQSFLTEQGNKLNYKNWLTLRDILTNNYFQIENDLNTGKINENELNELKQLAAQCN